MSIFKYLASKLFKNHGQKTANKVTRVLNSRVIELDKDDSCLILKKDGRSLIVGSDNTELQRNDEILGMVLLYLGNPEFIKVLDAMFAEAVDDVLSEMKQGRQSTKESRFSDGS